MRRFVFEITSRRNNRPLSIGQIINGPAGGDDDDEARERLKRTLIDLYSDGLISSRTLAAAFRYYGLRHV